MLTKNGVKVFISSFKKFKLMFEYSATNAIAETYVLNQSGLEDISISTTCATVAEYFNFINKLEVEIEYNDCAMIHNFVFAEFADTPNGADAQEYIYIVVKDGAYNE